MAKKDTRGWAARGRKDTRKNRIRPNHHFPPILPNYNLSERFCYFLDLLHPTSPNIPLNTRKNILGNAAVNQLIRPNEHILNIREDNDDTIITTAIEFLETVARNERNKEIMVVEQYIQRLQNSLPPNFLQQHQDLSHLIDELRAFSNNPENYDITDFYTNLIICLNSVRETFNHFSARVRQLISDNHQTVADMTADQYLFRLPGDITGILRHIIGIKAREEEDSFASNLQEIILEYVLNNVNTNQIIQDNFLETITALVIDFMKQLQLHQEQMGLNLDDINRQVLQQFFDSYINAPAPTILVDALHHNQQLFQDIIQQLGRNMGFSQLSQTSQEGQQRLAQIAARQNNVANRMSTRLLHQNPTLYNNIRMSQWINCDIKQDVFRTGRGGIMYEIYQTILDHTYRVGQAGGGTDTFTANLGRAQVDIDIQYRDMLFDAFRDIEHNISVFEHQTHHTRMEEITSNFNQMNYNLEQILNSVSQTIPIPENLFIYHNSLKLYTRLEQHDADVEQYGLDGRTIQILNIFDRLYSLEGINGLALIDRDTFYGIAINLAKNTVSGGRLKLSVENYLSIFAGMLMFDDIQNMAREAATQSAQMIYTQNVKNIHMYQINDIYIPGSLILSYIAQALRDGYTRITRTNAAQAQISTSAADNIITDYLDSHPYGSHSYSINDWGPTADEVAQSITVRIRFLAGFLTFLDHIAQQLP